MNNKLNKILIKELIKKVQLTRSTGLSSSTISNICNHKGNPTDITKGTIVKAVNNIISKEKYKLEDIFPENNGENY